MASAPLERLAALLRRRSRSPGAVLCFHGIDSAAAPSASSLHLSVFQFAAVIAAARDVGTVVALQELVARHLAGRGTTGLVAVTFDDAYASLTDLSEVLRREATPVTVFAVADALADGRRYWWDRIDDLFPHVPRERWLAFEQECGLSDEYRRGQPEALGPLRPLRQWVLRMHAGRWPQTLEAPLERLEAEVGRPTRQHSMKADELRQFIGSLPVDVGVHTRTHPVLPFVDDSEFDDEVRGGYAHLREQLSPVVPLLAVPFGLFDRRTEILARRAGMATCLTLEGRVLGADPLEAGISRFCVLRESSPGLLGLRLTRLGAQLDRWRGRGASPYPVLPSSTT